MFIIYYHPMFVHFPIAFILLECILLFLWKLFDNEVFEKCAYFILKLTLILLIPTVISGFIDGGSDIELIYENMRGHFIASMILTTLIAFRFFWFRKLRKGLIAPSKSLAYTSLAVFTLFLTFFTGHLGGKLVYYTS